MAKKNEQSISKELLAKRINLLPDHIKAKRRNSKRYFYALLLVGLLILGVTYYTMNIVNETKRLKAETEAASYRISLLKEQQDQQAIATILEEKIADKENLLNILKGKNESVGLILGMIDLSLPKGVVYSSISATNEAEIQVSGVSESYQQVADFIHNLKRTNHFDRVFLNESNKAIYKYSSSKLSITYYTYDITCTIGGESDEN